MSDRKPKRVGREPARHEPAPVQPPFIRTAETVLPQASVAPESATAAVEIVGAPPARPSPTAPFEPVSPAADSPEPARDAFGDAQAVLTRGFEEMATEFTALTRSGFAVASDAALALLGARTFAEIVEINAEMTRRSLDAMIDGTTRLSAIGIRTVTDASKPMLSRLADV